MITRLIPEVASVILLSFERQSTSTTFYYFGDDEFRYLAQPFYI